MMFSLILAAALQVAAPEPTTPAPDVQGPVDTEQPSTQADETAAAPQPEDASDAKTDEAVDSSADPKLVNQEMLIRKSLATWQGGAAKHDGKVGCVTKQTTGDKEIDAIRCGAVVMCFTPVAARLDALEANDKISDDERQTRMKVIAQTTSPCLKAFTDKAVVRLAKTRAGE